MNLRAKLALLADAAKYDASCAAISPARAREREGPEDPESLGIYRSVGPDGRSIALLKILLTNHCVYDCHYCVNRSSSDAPRARFTPEELVELTLDFHRRGWIEGLFLSSGIFQSPDVTLEQMAEVARSLREEHGYRGYIHLKAVPGASRDLVVRAGLYADRLSVNVELPTQTELDRLAPEKQLVSIEQTMRQIRARREQAVAEREESDEAPIFAPAGQTTQIIVGATPSPDAAYLAMASRLYERHRLRRVYYSAYSPIPSADEQLPSRSPPLAREHRLYQADWLMRHYGFRARELTTPEEPNLPLDVDPKLGWALRHRERFPVDVNRAPREVLLRVPGLGATCVERIVLVRRQRSLRLDDLARLGVRLAQARPFLITADHNPDALLLDRADLRARLALPPRQLELFAPGVLDPPVIPKKRSA